MSQSQTATDLLNTQLSANAYTQPTYSIAQETTEQTNEQFEDSPIFIRGNEKTGYFATIGNYRVTIVYEQKTDLIDELTHPNITLITRIMTLFVESGLRILNLGADDANKNNTSIQQEG